MFDLEFFLKLFPIMSKYIGVTLFISFCSLVISLAIAVIIAVSVYMKVPVLSSFCSVWISIFRGTPLLAQLFWLCYGLPQLLPFLQKLSVMSLLIMGLSFNASSYMAESLRGALSSVGKNQMEACLASGMTAFQGLRRIILPQAFRVAVPALSNNFVDIIKQSSLAFTLGIREIMAVAKTEGGSNFKFLEAFTAVMIIYWLLITCFNKIQKFGEKRLNCKYK
ncbi:amino acid ABC transporter permease [[Clostridium] scindens]|uniref:amino acid ABC transporter permease n=1 Tax=Clostridium scindens (strain JCM 10418 / VPI 12708) TaxID=29347 RepID=UPI00156DFE3F|nr:amino acid ABC transporter permease [[Clostridium] scindens]NSI90799.1 amino acid ABC transporter permease [[Clostridium] scindens]NSJ05414.1 amino acid ABC transporter permease [[Clostridium] scindens]